MTVFRHMRTFVPALVAFVCVATMTSFLAPADASNNDYCTLYAASSARRAACHWHDARGDASARADLLSAKVRAGKKAFVISFRVRNLKKTGSFVLGAGVGGWGANYIVHKRKRKIVVKEQTISEVQVYKKVSCHGAKVRWNARTNVVHARFPYKCSGSRGDYVINGIDFHSRGATDHLGKVYYRP